MLQVVFLDTSLQSPGQFGIFFRLRYSCVYRHARRDSNSQPSRFLILFIVFCSTPGQPLYSQGGEKHFGTISVHVHLTVLE